MGDREDLINGVRWFGGANILIFKFKRGPKRKIPNSLFMFVTVHGFWVICDPNGFLTKFCCGRL